MKNSDGWDAFAPTGLVALDSEFPELVTPPEIHEAVDVLLVIVEGCSLLGIERHLEHCARPVCLEVEDVAVTERVRQLAEGEEIFAVIVDIVWHEREGVERHGFAAHIRYLPGSRAEDAKPSFVGAEAQALAARCKGAPVS